MSDLLRPFGFEFFVNGLIVATLAGALCGLVGVYVVLKGMSYIGHGLSHAIFGGFAASALLGVNFFLGAGAWGRAWRCRASPAGGSSGATPPSGS